MNTKIKFKAFSLLFTVIFIFSILLTPAVSVSAGLINSNTDGNDSYIAVSSPVGKSLSSPLYDETPPLSPAVNIIRGKFEMKKTAMLNSDINFKPEEFEKILGIKKLNAITITKLPDFSEGVLVLGGSEILEGQTVSRENIQYIRLVPYPDRIGAIKFSFRNAGDTTQNASIQCVVSVLESLKFNPSAEPISITTQKNTAVYKSMLGTDPDGCDIYYRIIKGPKNGLLEVKDTANGLFVYRPNKNFTGNDSFVYQVEDQYGNVSELASAQIKVTKAACSVKFTDMDDHWAANSAIKAVAAGFIEVDSDDPDLMFEPDLSMPRVEFVKMVMKAAKLDRNMPETYNTVFADDSDIPFEYKPYIAKAYDLGIIKGIPTETGIYFKPDSIITRAEAAVIINNILKIPTGETAVLKPVFSDNVSIPEWAENDMAALNSCGIIKGDENGNANPNGLLNKAQSAEMLCAMLDYNQSLKKTNGLFSFLFK